MVILYLDHCVIITGYINSNADVQSCKTKHGGGQFNEKNPPKNFCATITVLMPFTTVQCIYPDVILTIIFP